MLNGHPLLTYGFLALLLWMCVATVVRACTLPRASLRGGVCGRCRYPYSGWYRCPECGSAIAQSGVLTPSLAARLRGSWVGILIGLLFIGFAVAYVSSTSLNALAKQAKCRVVSRQQSFTHRSSAHAPFGLLIHWESIIRDDRVTDGRVRIVIDGVAAFNAPALAIDPTVGRSHTKIDLASGRFVTRNANRDIVHRGPAFGSEDAFDLLAMASLPIGSDEARILAGQIAETVKVEFAADPYGLRGNGAPVMYGGSASGSVEWSLPSEVLGLRGREGINALAAFFATATVIITGGYVVRCRRALLTMLDEPEPEVHPANVGHTAT